MNNTFLLGLVLKFLEGEAKFLNYKLLIDV